MDVQDPLSGKSESFSPFKFFVIFFIFIILVNLAYIDFVTFFGEKSDVVQKPASPESSITPASQKAVQENDFCPQSCIAQIQEATSSYKLLSTTQIISPAETKASTGVKEFHVPFGPGSSSAGDWQDIFGLQTYIDTANYEAIKKVTFEAYVRIPTGNQTAYVRLFNKTDKHPVWFSEVSLTGGTPSLLTSEPITLDKGNKLYQVQMKTQLQFQAILDQARVRIITN